MKQHTIAAAAILSNDVANNATYDVTTVTRNIIISNTPDDVYAVDSTVGSITITLPLISTIATGKGLFTISDYKGNALLRNIIINAGSIGRYNFRSFIKYDRCCLSSNYINSDSRHNSLDYKVVSGS
jgi:hypothetical protein